jgi:hypothetical protein
LSPSSLGVVYAIALVALTIVALTFFVDFVVVIITALAVAVSQCLLSTAIACLPAAHNLSADPSTAAASHLLVEPLLPLMALDFITADCYIIALAPTPSTHYCS